MPSTHTYLQYNGFNTFSIASSPLHALEHSFPALVRRGITVTLAYKTARLEMHFALHCTSSKKRCFLMRLSACSNVSLSRLSCLVDALSLVGKSPRSHLRFLLCRGNIAITDWRLFWYCDAESLLARYDDTLLRHT